MVKDYKELQVWQRGRALVQSIYTITKAFPGEEQYCLTSQMRRAAISVPSNIAEGQLRGSTKDYLHFITIAIGSLAELETQIILAEDLDYITDASDILEEVTVLRKMLWSLRNKLKT